MMTTKPPFISVITVTKNNIDGLRRTAISLQTQDTDDYEWIVIDGGSTDNTLSFMVGKDARYISEKDEGIYDAMNKGLSQARGDYIIFMNAGDSFAAGNVLSRLRDNTGNADFIFGDALETDNEGYIFYKPARPARKFRHGMITHHQAMVYRRDAIGKLRYDLRYRVAADFAFTLNFIDKNVSMNAVNFPICVFEGGGLSQQYSTHGRREQFRVRHAHGVNPVINGSIFALQSAAWLLRRLSPRLYWRMKSHH